METIREKNLSIKDPKAMIEFMAEGRTRAALCMMKIMALVGTPKAISYMVVLDDMNIRGRQIEIAVEYVGANYTRLLEMLTPVESARKAGPEWTFLYGYTFARLTRERAALVAEINRKSIKENIPHVVVACRARKNGRQKIEIVDEVISTV